MQIISNFIELVLICVQGRFGIPVVTQISVWLFILCQQMHDFQLKLHYSLTHFGS